jgi:hypothetical protein
VRLSNKCVGIPLQCHSKKLLLNLKVHIFNSIEESNRSLLQELNETKEYNARTKWFCILEQCPTEQTLLPLYFVSKMSIEHINLCSKKRRNFLNSSPTSKEGALRLPSTPSGRFRQQTAICPVSLWTLVVELHPRNWTRAQAVRWINPTRQTACARAQFSGCSSTTNAHSETGQMAVCFQNLPLGALCSRSAPSVLVGEQV